MLNNSNTNENQINALAGEAAANPPARDDLEAWQDWLLEFAAWRSFITLEFKDIVGKVKAQGCWRSLLQDLNRDAFGTHYTRIVGHCYFAYVVGYEKQQRGSFHMHAVIDRPINFQLVHDRWHVLGGDNMAWKYPGDKNHIGFAWIEQIKNRIAVIKYVTKYVAKGGDLDVYKPRRYVDPVKPLTWWR